MIVEPLVLFHDRKTTLAGLREALSVLPLTPPPLTFQEYEALDQDERALFDQAREDFLRLTLRVPTPEQDLGTRLLSKLIATNPRRKNSRRGLMVSAPMFYGKTELALLLARSVELDHSRRFPEYADAGEVPVVWVEVTDNATGKALLAQIIRFLAPTISLPLRETTDALRHRAVELMHLHRTKVLIVDEAHNLGGSEPSSVIKAIQNESSATVVLVGIDLASGKAFGKGEGLQVTMRCDFIELRKVDAKAEDGLALWQRWVAIFDRHLPLCGHVPGTLTRNSSVLHAAADGRLSILALIIERLQTRILDDPTRSDEVVTRRRLFSVLEEIRYTTRIKHNVKLEDLVDAA